MPYRFKLSEPFEAGVRRIGLRQIDRATAQLQSANDQGGAIHETRKALKRVRALLRLARPGLGEDVYGSENARYRTIGQSLSAARDAQVLLETVTAFESKALGRTKSAFAAVKLQLSGEPQLAANPCPTAAVELALHQLAEGRGRLEELVLPEPGFEIAWDGMARAYRQAIRAFENAYKTHDCEDLHTWRKRVQTHWRHMALLREAWPEMLDARITTAKQLSTLLGEDHDIAVMQAAIETGNAHLLPVGAKALKPKPRLSAHQHKLTQAVAVARQQHLRQQCRTLGQRLFAESPSAFRDRMATYWAAAADLRVEPS